MEKGNVAKKPVTERQQKLFHRLLQLIVSRGHLLSSESHPSWSKRVETWSRDGRTIRCESTYRNGTTKIPATIQLHRITPSGPDTIFEAKFDGPMTDPRGDLYWIEPEEITVDEPGPWEEDFLSQKYGVYIGRD